MNGDERPEYLIAVGPVPSRRGQWLGVQRGATWTALAKFRSDQAAEDFVALMAKLSDHEVKVE